MSVEDALAEATRRGLRLSGMKQTDDGRWTVMMQAGAARHVATGGSIEDAVYLVVSKLPLLRPVLVK